MHYSVRKFPISAHPGGPGRLPALHMLPLKISHARASYLVCRLSLLNETANCVVRN